MLSIAKLQLQSKIQLHDSIMPESKATHARVTTIINALFLNPSTLWADKNKSNTAKAIQSVSKPHWRSPRSHLSGALLRQLNSAVLVLCALERLCAGVAPSAGPNLLLDWT